MQYVKMVKMSIEEAKRRCKKNAIILVATQDLEDDDIDAVFIPKKRDEYDEVFENVETVASLCDDLVKQ